MWYGCVCRTVRVFEIQAKNNGVDKFKAMLQKGFDGTIVPIKKQGLL